MNLTYYGHSCFAVELPSGERLLFDPFITANPLAAGIDIETITADYILISHGHGDHIADAVTVAKRTGALVICVWEISEWLAKQGVTNVRPMNTGGSWRAPFGTVQCVVAQHSSMLPDGSNGGNPVGFVVATPHGTFYYAGDTALTLDMQLIPRRYRLDAAILPIGDNFTMGIEDAVVAAEFLQCSNIIGVHFDTFDLIRIDHEAARRAFAERGYTLRLPSVGATLPLLL
ncbi:MAG: metal-dependent hydrolase [Bacteroidota bacterium]|nr:metal-dependent hydrolase [Candidatus Kapabacteria bacterium]MCS7303405.1 metal-dependent hydrolase [Candidatus Kapabacteria bacterium]MDW8075663.1 metal-dependent hydrolase [Bacteroidota bacterium]MDW8272280.1 metal-dependent hydrolase [Bacteroidota bacterium]